MKTGSQNWWTRVGSGVVLYGRCYLCHREPMALLWCRIPERAAQVGCCIDEADCEIAQADPGSVVNSHE